MKPRQLVALSVTVLALIGFAGYEARVARRHEQELSALRQRALQLAADAAALGHERDVILKTLAEAEQQLAALPPPRADDASVSPTRRAEMNAWLARVKRLRALFDAGPDQRIPEMQFLTDLDWLRVAKYSHLDSAEGVRSGLAAIRDAATAHFMIQLSGALRKFVRNSPGDTVTGSLALAPYFETPVDPTMLSRYELAKTNDDRPQWRVRTRAPLDADYDSRHEANADADGRGYGRQSLYAPRAWIPDFREQSARAYQAYADTHNGTSATSLADVLPFFSPPLAPALADKLLKAEREYRR